MCPSHLVEKWKAEMETYIPNAKGYIIHNIDELLELEPKLRSRYKVENSFVIMSKEIAKLGYDKRPAAIWSKSKKCYVCPDCGKQIYKWENQQLSPWSSRKTKVKVNLTELDFLKPFSYNQICPECKTKLWTALNRDDQTHSWIKLGEAGWIQQEFIESKTEDFLTKEKIEKKDTTLFNKLFDQYTYYQEHGHYNITYKGPKKYPVADYIHERMNGVFDYLALDEAHLLMNQS